MIIKLMSFGPGCMLKNAQETDLPCIQDVNTSIPALCNALTIFLSSLEAATGPPPALA